MTCPSCGNENNENSSFCVKCGANLKEIIKDNKEENAVTEEITNQENKKYASEGTVKENNVYEEKVERSTTNKPKPELSNYIKFVINMLIKPFDTFKKEENKLCDTKTSLIYGGIIAVSMMLITLIKSMIMSIFTKSMDFSTFKYKTTVDFSRLKDLDYISLIFKNLLIYAGIIAIVALVYYLVGLIFKKKINYIKTLSKVSMSLIPFLVLAMIVSPILGIIWTPLAIIAMVTGAVYTILIFMNLISEDIEFEDIDKKMYFHLICLSVLGSAGYYIYVKLMVASVSNNIDSILNMLG